MNKLLVFVLVAAGCQAGVLHHSYTPVIQQYVVPQQEVLSYPAPAAPSAPLLYTSPVIAPAEKKAPSQRQRLVKKAKQVQPPPPESFSYQIRVQHAEQPKQEQRFEAQQEFLVPVQQVQQIQSVIPQFEYQQQVQAIPYPTAPARRLKSSRIQTKPAEVQTKEKNIEYTYYPQYTPVQYTPVFYYYPGVTGGHPVQPPKRPVQPPQEEEEEEDAEEEDGLETFDRFQDAEEDSDVVESEAPVSTKKAPKSVIFGQLRQESPILTYQNFNAGW